MGDESMKGGTRALQLKLSEKEYELLKERAEKEDISVTALLRRYIALGKWSGINRYSR
jgi:hypothetical protein